MTNIYKSKFTGEQIDNSVERVVSNTATEGQVLTADGAGGASWKDPAGGGTEVVANPALAGTESDLTGLEVAGTKYKVPSGGGTEVIANPTGKAMEELTKLQVGSSVYSIPTGGSGGGTKLYFHKFKDGSSGRQYTFISTSPIPLSVTLKKDAYIINNIADIIPYAYTYYFVNLYPIYPLVRINKGSPGSNDTLLCLGETGIINVTVEGKDFTDTVTPL